MEITWGIKTTRFRCGITQTNASNRAWPGYSFSEHGSSAQATLQSISALASVLGIPDANIVMVSQVHGTGVSTLTVLPSRAGERVGTADIIVTNLRLAAPCIRVADCCGVVLYDTANHAVAVVHSGWRGTAAKAVHKALASMNDTYTTHPKNVLAWLSPCASANNYQVGNDVRQALPEWCTQDPAEPEKWYYDNHEAIKSQLISTGMVASNIQVCSHCTIADSRYHSYRRDKELSGRSVVFAVLL